MADDDDGKRGNDPDTSEEGQISFQAEVFKVMVLGRDIEAPSSINDEDAKAVQNVFKKTQTLQPPFDPVTLMRIWENSSSLGQNIQAYATNIDGLGHRLESEFAFETTDGFEKVREAMWLQDHLEREDDDFGDLPSDDAVTEQIEVLKRRSRLEHLKLDAFVKNANPEGSFVTLRRDMRTNLEITGNAYWEVLRNKVGKMARFVNVPSTHMRLTAQDDDPTKVEDKVSAGPMGWDTVVQWKFFRRFVQVIGTRIVYFKEFGDPRIVSRDTGVVYKDEAAWMIWKTGDGKTDEKANEIFHFKITRPGEAYGVPRWIGNLLAVMGSRAADEVNFQYFDNKAIPPMALLVTGGRLGEDSVSKIETYIRDNIKGKENFHKILIIEAHADAEAAMVGNAPTPKLEFKDLSNAQQGDALFQKYDERNIDKVGSSFRLPRLMRGDVRDFNRATADASRRFAEEQVFEPERREFDSVFNRRILPELDIRLWLFRSLGHQSRDPEVMSEIVEKLVKSTLSPNDCRALMADALGRDLPPYEEEWANQPLTITQLGIRPKPADDGNGVDGESEDDRALRILTEDARRLAAGQEGALDAARDAADDALNDDVENDVEDQENNDG